MELLQKINGVFVITSVEQLTGTEQIITGAFTDYNGVYASSDIAIGHFLVDNSSLKEYEILEVTEGGAKLKIDTADIIALGIGAVYEKTEASFPMFPAQSPDKLQSRLLNNFVTLITTLLGLIVKITGTSDRIVIKDGSEELIDIHSEVDKRLVIINSVIQLQDHGSLPANLTAGNGMIRWNESKLRHEGYDGNRWQPFYNFDVYPTKDAAVADGLTIGSIWVVEDENDDGRPDEALHQITVIIP